MNRAPTAANDVLRADATALASINVLTNDNDPDNDKLTVTIEEPAWIGTAVANADGTVRIDSLPGDFKGVTRFKYRVTDPAGLTTTATAVIFVGADPFRVIFAGDATVGATELYLFDLLSTATQLSTANDTTLHLKGFAASANGTTVVYRRASTSTPVTSDLSFVRTATPKQDARITFPAGATLMQDAQGNDQFAVSDDGQWIVAIARDALNADAAYVVNVDTPSTVTKVSIPGTVRAARPKFSSDSKALYLLASPATNGNNYDLFIAALPGLAVSQISAPTATSSDNVFDYSIASNQSRFVLLATRGGSDGLYFVDPTQLQTEVRVSQASLGLSRIPETTLSLPPGAGGSIRGDKIAYTVESTIAPLSSSTWVADVSSTPNPRRISALGTSARVGGFRPDDGAVSYLQGGEVKEAPTDASSAGQPIGTGISSWYDSTGNIVLLKQLQAAGGGSSYPALAVAVRGSFGTPQSLGTGALAAHFIDVSGFDRAVVILGEGPTTGAAPTTARLALVNALAPDKLLYLADFLSPIQLTTSASRVVRN